MAMIGIVIHLLWNRLEIEPSSSIVLAYLHIALPIAPLLYSLTAIEWFLCKGQNSGRTRMRALFLLVLLPVVVPGPVLVMKLIGEAWLQGTLANTVAEYFVNTLIACLIVGTALWTRALLSLWLGVGPDRDFWLPTVFGAGVASIAPSTLALAMLPGDFDPLLLAGPLSIVLIFLLVCGGFLYGSITSWIVVRAKREKLGVEGQPAPLS